MQFHEDCSDLQKRPNHHSTKRASSTGQDSAVQMHLKVKGHSFEDDKCPYFGVTGVTEAFYCPFWTEVVAYSISYQPPTMQSWDPSPGVVKPHSHGDPCDLSSSHDGGVGQCLTKDSHLGPWDNNGPYLFHILVYVTLTINSISATPRTTSTC